MSVKPEEENPSILNEDDEYFEPGEETPQDAEGKEMDDMMDLYLDSMGSSSEVGQLLQVPIIAIQGETVLVDVGSKAEGMVQARELHDAEGNLPYKIGDKIDVVVKGTDSDSGMVLLSHHEARHRAALNALEEAFNKQTPLEGKVVRAVKGGLIVDFGTTAFLPASQIDVRRTEDFEPWVGKQVECVVLEFAPKNRRVIVSRRKHIEADLLKKRKELLDRLNVGDVIEAKVKRLVDFGAFVDLGGIDGLIPRGEISWQRTAKPEDYLKVDDAIEVKVLQIDSESQKITLTRRQLTPDPWKDAAERFPEGTTTEGEVVSLTNYGAFVRVAEGLDGMVHVNDIAWDTAGKRPSDYFTEGQKLTAQILAIDPEQRRISLGVKQLSDDPWSDVQSRYPKGTRVKGKITGLKKYGAFMELEPGIKGMIHVSDFSWEKRISEPREVVAKGDEVEACVLSVDSERRRISLGVKQLDQSPVDKFAMGHREGSIAEGKIAEITEVGVHLEMPGGVRGFIHVSQLDVERVENIGASFKVGQEIKAEVTKINPKTNEVRLSRRQMLKNEERTQVKGYLNTASGHGRANLGELLAELSLEDDLPPE